MERAVKLSLVIPVYYNEENLLPLYEDLRENLIEKIDFGYELVFVDDGSRDRSWEVLRQLQDRDEHVRLLRLSRNFGSHSAVMCGLSHSTGECVVVKAADQQEPTALVLEMVRKWEEGNNIVLAVREGREDPSFFADFYYWICRKFIFPKMPKGGFDTYLLDRKVIRALEGMNEPDSPLTGQILWSGFRTDSVYYVRKERTAGKSRWTLSKKLKLVTNTFFSFSNLPIGIITGVGIFSVLMSAIWAIVVLIFRLRGSIPVSGWTTLFIFNLFSFGIIMFSIGILGGYLWRTFSVSRHRPAYIVEEEK